MQRSVRGKSSMDPGASRRLKYTTHTQLFASLGEEKRIKLKVLLSCRASKHAFGAAVGIASAP